MEHCKECGKPAYNKVTGDRNPIKVIRRVAVYAKNKLGRYLPTGNFRTERVCEDCCKYTQLI